MDDIKPPKRPDPLVKTDVNEPKDEPAFMPPEEVAAKEDKKAAIAKEPMPEFHDKQFDKPKKKRLAFLHPKTRKGKIILWSVLVLFILGSVAAYWFLIKPMTSRSVNDTALEKKPYIPPTEANKLTGVQVDPAVNKRAVTAVMIENSPESRPQSGLKDAGVVFEAVAEGGITRFVALYQDTQPDYIGPIRSVRPYYIDWFMPFDGSIAHVGGSPQALADIKSLGAKDLDQFANSTYYTRINSRSAPHNVYSSIAKLNELMNKKGYTSANFTGFERKKDAASTTPTAKTVNLNISSALFNVKYEYDTATNTYKRSVGGVAHTDERSKAQLTPKTVVAIVMTRGIDKDGQHTAYTTTGSGKMYVFQDGVVTEGTWSKASRTAQWKFADANGKSITLNAGQTWISMVDKPTSVTYQP